MLPPSYKHIFLFKLCSFSILFYPSCRDSSLKRLISLALPSHIFQFKQVDTVSNLGSCLGLNQIPKPFVEEQWLYSESHPNDQATRLISKGEPSHPFVYASRSPVLSQPIHRHCCRPLISIAENIVESCCGQPHNIQSFKKCRANLIHLATQKMFNYSDLLSCER